jgi:hypothetical protein
VKETAKLKKNKTPIRRKNSRTLHGNCLRNKKKKKKKKKIFGRKRAAHR